MFLGSLIHSNTNTWVSFLSPSTSSFTNPILHTVHLENLSQGMSLYDPSVSSWLGDKNTLSLSCAPSSFPAFPSVSNCSLAWNTLEQGEIFREHGRAQSKLQFSSQLYLNGVYFISTRKATYKHLNDEKNCVYCQQRSILSQIIIKDKTYCFSPAEWLIRPGV